MKREFYLSLARAGLRMPIGTDLRTLMERHGVDLLFHDCGELSDVLHVDEAAEGIRRKVDLMLTLEVN